MTEQDCRPAPARAEIVDVAAATRYARAGAYGDAPAPADPARAKFPAGPGGGTPPPPTEPREPGEPGECGEPGDPQAAAPAEQPAAAAEQPGPRRVRYPLRRRGRNIREAGHAAYDDAPTPWAGLAAAFDYARSAYTRADAGGMHHPPADDALIEVGRALMAVGDTLTTAMHTWSPQRGPQ